MVAASSKQPLYDQLADILRDKILNELKSNDVLPSERDLTLRYGLSRTTVRLALQELEKQGLVYRRHGKGTFVSGNGLKATNLSQTYSFSDQMHRMGRDPKTNILEFEVIEASKYFAMRMGIHIGDRLYRIKRLRFADGVPMMIECTYLPVNAFISLTREDLEQTSLYEVLEHSYNEKIHVAEEEFYASVATKEDAKLLEIGEGAPVLDLDRVTTNVSNEVIEFTLSVARADQFKYKVSHYRQ